MPATKTKNVIRTNYGSHRVVKKVFMYDTINGTITAKLSDGTADTFSLSELECLEPDLNTYADLDAALRAVAKEMRE